MNEQHVWSHHSRHHQPSAALTDEPNQQRRLQIDIINIAQHETTAATVPNHEALSKCIRRAGAAGEKSSSPNPRGNTDEGFQLMCTIYANRIHYVQGSQECCDIHGDINCDEGGDSAWWKQIKDLYPRLKGSSCYSNRAIHHKGTSVPGRQADALPSWW